MASKMTAAELAELLSEWERYLEHLMKKLERADDALCALDNSQLEPGENHPSHVAEIHRYERKMAVAKTAISTLKVGGRLDEAFAAMACHHEGETAAAFEAAAKKWAGH